MTGDEECSVVEISQLEKSLSSNTSLPATQPITTTFITSNMTVRDSYLYTAALPSELTGSFPEGTVLQIMPDSTIVAVAVKDLPLSNENSIIYKDPTALVENTQNGLNLPNLLTEPNEQNVDIPVCSEENISDIDLSFLNETEENTPITDSKCLNDNSVKELQGIISDVSSQSLNIFQNSLNLPENNGKACQEPEEVASKQLQQSNEAPNNVVMIDVTKPIQLSQNSLIMVNGQKCVLQHDPQSGQVIAYPVKEQDKPRRKRGRPRKTLVEKIGKGAKQSENNTLARDTDSLSEEEREKGLLEVVNDDGSLVRRSSRKRKRAKTLRDYETGNLKQELGSDLEDAGVIDKEIETCSRKKKARGPGRPRKYNNPVDSIVESSVNNGVKRPRGRPKKIIPESEPTQAFLVQTADGQILMMQVPLSSIPPGISLQEMAQEIANKLNLGLSKGKGAKEPSSKLDEQVDVNTSEGVDTVSEPALQDHCVGSTTNFSNIPPDLSSTSENSNIVDSTCQDIIHDMNQIIGNPVSVSDEVVLESNSCAKIPNVPENFPKNQCKINILDVPQCSEDSFCFNIPSTTTPNDSSSMLCNLEDALTDHDFFRPKSSIPNPHKEISNPIQASESHKVPKDFLTKSDVLKDKVDFPMSFQTENLIDSESQGINIEELLNKNLNSESADRLVLSIDKLKHFNVSCDSVLSENKTIPIENKYVIQEMPNIDCPDQISRNVIKSVDIEAKADVNSAYLQDESVVESVEYTDVITNDYLNSTNSEEVKSVEKTSTQFLKSDEPHCENERFVVDLPLQPTSLSLESSVQKDNIAVTSSSTTVIPVPEKVLPMLIPAQSADGPKNCKICQVSYSTHEELIQHFKLNHPKCICTECNYMNEHPYVIRRHAFRHTNHGCVCKICNKKYKDLYILKMHIKMVHLPPDVLYACEICEKKFTRKAHLKRHLRIHAPVKQYQCPHCDYKGCEKSDITKHLLIHEEPKYKCEICGKAFRHAKNKDLHVKRHSGQRDYKCAACGFFGYTYTDIRKHIERRHSVACPQCKQVFSDIELLKEHKRIESCQTNLFKESNEIKIEEGPSVIVEDKDTDLLDGVPLDILDTDQPQVMTISECTEETLSALQNGQLIMTSVDGIFNPESGQLVVEDNSVTSDTLSVVAVEGDSTKTITFVTSDGKNVSIPVKNCSLPLECVTAITETTITEPFLLTKESEATS